MLFSRLFKRRKENPEQPAQEKPEASIPQGIHYLYLIMGLQVAFVFGMLGVIMVVGKVISTPGWVFLFIMVLFAASMVYIYRKAKQKLRMLRESLGNSDLSNKNYEISLMGGMLTMRIEQNPNAPKLLEAPGASSAEPIIDAEKIEPAPGHKQAHLS